MEPTDDVTGVLPDLDPAEELFDWDVNVGPVERGASIALGAALVALALSRRRGVPALVAGAVGGYLAWRGATGHCALYDLLDSGGGFEEEEERLAAGAHRDPSAEAVTTIQRPVEEVYAFWRRLENLPRFMKGIQSVSVTDDLRSRWVATGPGGTPLEWEAEILEDRPGELIAWRAMPGSRVHQVGAVRFRPAPGGRGTEVRLDLELRLPGGGLGRTVARLAGVAGDSAAAQDLRRLRELMEAGETATTEGQPKGGPKTPVPALP